MSASPLAGKVCIVTGATRGIGKGIALQLAEKGAKVYITGRTLDPPRNSEVGGSLRETANEIERRGGICVPVQCDHSKDNDIEQLFEQVKRENENQLDILVNNAYSAVNVLSENYKVKFWDQPPSIWDDVNVVGLRNHYICAVYASRIMVPRKRGLIVNISSSGGLRYLIGVAYGIGKEACDRMAADCAVELKKHNVAFVSLWPGAVGTEIMLKNLRNQAKKSTDSKDRSSILRDEKILKFFEGGETPEFAGQCIAAMATDDQVMKMSGKIVLTCDLARRYNLTDAAGHTPTEMRQINKILEQSGHPWLAWFVPSFIRLPSWILCLAGNKFY
ncbi:dehydrogenase/reductase SDR family member 1-like [Ruditapes philippinarum]|uniref:dehydrogenase/reductase SDR family member 1-like n=1 Tax=Ruditapes philippinarum TaxID=129788 RepID=UPI00295AAF3E|nr:dehydrogenase/reductase SDR family member 1-like [Ruditapes philippinarum]